MMKFENLSRNALLGLAVGDALGVPVEFMSRAEVRAVHLTEMIGCGDDLPFESRWGEIIPAGAWSDDTSMTIASMDAILTHKTVDYDAMMQNFVSWWHDGKYTSLNMPFGLGGIISEALERYIRGVPALECGGTGLFDNGNGALMRIFPFSAYCIRKNMPESETVDFIGKASAITHANDISKMSCFLYTEFLKSLILTKNPEQSYREIIAIDYGKYFSEEAVNAHGKILNSDFLHIRDDQIDEDNGYVIYTLESVLYSILTTSNYEDAVLKAINMGYDTDTIGSITGGLAGALYGAETIPSRWLARLRKKTELEKIADDYDIMLKG